MRELTEEEKIRMAKAAYMREWYARNREKKRKANARYWVKKFEKMQEERKREE